MTTNARQAVLDRAVRQPPEQPAAARAPSQEGAEPRRSRPAREGRRFVGAHFHPEVARQLKMLAAEDGATIQELLEQAIDLLFVKNGRAKSAELIGGGKSAILIGGKSAELVGDRRRG